MKKIIIISIFICFSVGLTVFANMSDIITAEIVDNKISLSGRVINDNLKNPLISYNDRTYMSVRDIAMMIARDVSWDEERESIHFIKPDHKNHLIKSEETALVIGKAISEEHYSDRINTDTKYLTTYFESGSSGIDYYEVSIMFNPPLDREVEFLEMINDCDVKVNIGAATGGTSVSENQNGSWVLVSGRLGILEID